METKPTYKRRSKGLVFAALTAFAVILGLVAPGLAPLMGAQAADPDFTGDIIVEKSFVGLDSGDVPENFAINLESAGHSYTTDGAEVVPSDSEFVKRWKINNANIGTYSVSETGAEVPGYTLTSTTGLGQSVEVTAPEFTVDTLVHETTCSHNDWPVSIANDTNTFFAASLTGNSGSIVVTYNDLPQYQREVVKAKVLNLGGPFKSPVNFYSIETNGTQFQVEGKKESKITYTPGNINIGETSDWQHVASLAFNITQATPKVSVTNTYTPDLTSVKVSKVWDDYDNQDGMRPASVTIKLLANGVDTGKTVVLSEDNNWTATFTDLRQYSAGKPISYTVSEETVEGYNDPVISGDAANGYTVTNTHTPEVVTISGSKTWDDADDQDGKRPESITIRLLKNGTEIDSKTVSAEDGWAWSFTDLPVYADGEEIVYTITEDAVDGYDTKLDGYNVTNKHTPELIDINGSKTWDDADDQDGKRPESITIRLLADGQEVASKVVTEADGWSWLFTDLPVYADGEEIVYTITEDAVEDYSATVDGYNVTNTHTPGKTSVQVTKAWDDANNQDGVRPDAVEIKLLADGEETGKVLTLNADNKWTATFTELDEYKAGQLITYTIEEVNVENGHTSEITGDAQKGFVVTNSRTPETVMVEGMKTWDDADNKSGKRPESITIRVLADGKEVGVKNVTAADEWAWSFEDLPKFNSGEEIVYTITEDEVEGYETTVDGYNVTNKIIPEKPQKPSLPKTGVATGAFLGLSTLLLAAGTALVGIRRRRS